MSASAYAILGGPTPYTQREMISKVATPLLGEHTAHMRDADEGVLGDYQQQFETRCEGCKDWKRVYLSHSYQGYARISPDDRTIIGNVLKPWGLVGIIFTKNE